MSMVLIVAGAIALAVADVPLVTFDGSVQTSFDFKKYGEGNRPASSGTWRVEDGYGVFDGEVHAEWSGDYAGWPGLIRASAEGAFPDASMALGGALILTVRSTTPDYSGFRVSFGSTEKWSAEKACGGDLGPIKGRGCYKANFRVPAGGDFVAVRIPFSDFSDFWLHGSGELYKTCAEDKKACPTAKTLASIKRIELWAEGVSGPAHLEVKSIAVSPAASASELV